MANICNSVYDQNLTKSDTLWDRTEHCVLRWNAVSTSASHCYGLWVFTTSLTVSKQASSEIRSHKIAVWLQEILRGTKTASDSLPCLLLGKPPRSHKQTQTTMNSTGFCHRINQPFYYVWCSIRWKQSLTGSTSTLILTCMFSGLFKSFIFDPGKLHRGDREL